MADPNSLDALLRTADYDRYLSTLFAPAEARPHLIALYAFNHEIAKTWETVSQPTIGLIRLQWWRETIEGIYTGNTRTHDVAEALARAVGAHDLPRPLFDAMIDARELDLEEMPFGSFAEFDAYADATSGHLMRLAVRILGAGQTLDGAAGMAGAAYALTGLLRALPFRAARRSLVLPLQGLHGAQVDAEDIFSGKGGAGLSSLMDIILRSARMQYERVQVHPIARGVLPALLPATLVPLYARALSKRGFDPFRHSPELSPLRRQVAMLAATVWGRI